MSNRRGDYYADDEWEEPASSPPKRARNVYQVSESDQDLWTMRTMMVLKNISRIRNRF